MKLAWPFAIFSLLDIAFADCGVDGGTITIANPDYTILDELETCETIYGDILIDPAYVYVGLIGGPFEITGTIIAHNNVILKSVFLQNATRLGGFSFLDPEIDGNVNFPEMRLIGDMEWRLIRADFSWSAPKLTAIGNLNIHGTLLSGFTADSDYEAVHYGFAGLDVLQTADNVRLVDNVRMDVVVLNGLKTVTNALIVGDNKNYYQGEIEWDPWDPKPLLVSFPSLESAGSVAVYDISVDKRQFDNGKIDFPSLGHVTGNFEITDIKGLTELSVPVLTDIDGGLKITSNTALTNIEFPLLRNVDHIEVVADTRVGFDTVSFPAVEKVGSFYLNSANNFDCSSLDSIRAIASNFTCITNNDSGNSEIPPTTTESPPPSQSSPEASSTEATDNSQTAQTESPTADSSSTSGPSPTESANSTPIPAETVPASGGASSLRSPIGGVILLLKHWVSYC
ncbi:hypothetical protein F5Y18DRAFT_378708 [Xylariaceae sp. FL1019]|nr:hypothetical protein F5Y18DRAFT_378708 [Xylariaceae sp. FL1019]